MTDKTGRLSIIDGAQPRHLLIAGEVDALTAPRLEERLREVDGGEGDIVLEMAEVGFIDSMGLRVLITTHRRLAQMGRRLELRSPSVAVRRLLEITGLEDHFDVSAPS